MNAEELTGKQRRYLRGLGVHLKATVFVGSSGITEPLLASVRDAHSNAELIKVKIERACPLDRKTAGRELADATASHLVQILGRTVLLYRADPDEPVIQLPARSGA